MPQQKPSYATFITWTAAFSLLVLAAAGVSAWYSIHLLRSADTPREAQGSDFQPRMLLITNEQHVVANVQLSYYANGYSSTIGSLTLEGGHPGTFPVGIRYLQISFSGAQPGKSLEYSILFNQDAESDIYGVPFANSRNLPQNPVSPGSPGPEVIGNCSLPENMKFAQLVFGAVTATSNGNASTQMAALMNNRHPYLATGDTDIVNVMEFLPTSADTATAGTVTGCKWKFPDSPYLGGVQWYTPATLTGAVNIGALQGDYTVQAANPALQDLSSLYWEFSGPTAINYILTDNSVTRQAGDDLFWAGILAALATGFLIEFIKTGYELHGEIAEVREKRTEFAEREDEKKERETERADHRKERAEDRATLETLTQALADLQARLAGANNGPGTGSSWHQRLGALLRKSR